MNNSKIVYTKITTAIILAFILIAGTFAVISPPFITGANAQAQPYYGYNNYGSPEYPDNRYQKSYGNDNSYYETQYSSYKPDYKPKYLSYGKN